MTTELGFTELIFELTKLRRNKHLKEPGAGEAVYAYLAVNKMLTGLSMVPLTPQKYVDHVEKENSLPKKVKEFMIANYKEPTIDLQETLDNTKKLLELFKNHAPNLLYHLIRRDDVLLIPIKVRDENYTDYTNRNSRKAKLLDNYNAYIFTSDLLRFRRAAIAYFMAARYRPGLFSEDWIVTVQTPMEAFEDMIVNIDVPPWEEIKMAGIKPKLVPIKGGKGRNPNK